LFEIRIFEIFLKGTGQRHGSLQLGSGTFFGIGKSPGTHVLQVRHGNVKQILKFLGHAKIFNDEFRLFAEVAIDLQRFLCIDMRHLKIIFYVRKMNSMEYN